MTLRTGGAPCLGGLGRGFEDCEQAHGSPGYVSLGIAQPDEDAPTVAYDNVSSQLCFRKHATRLQLVNSFQGKCLHFGTNID